MATMQLKTYRAPTMQAALARVKEDLGHDAVILHARTLKEGGMLGLGAQSVVEITASDDPQAMQSTRRIRRATRPMTGTEAEPFKPGIGKRPVSTSRMSASQPAPQSVHQSVHQSAMQPEAQSPLQPVPQFEPKPLPRSETAQLQAVQPTQPTQPRPSESARAASAPAHPRVRDPDLATSAAASDGGGSARARMNMEEELASIKLLVGQVLRESRRGSRGSRVAAQAAGGNGAGLSVGVSAGALDAEYLALLEQRVADEIADEVIGRVRGSLDDDGVRDPERVREALLEVVGSMIPSAGDVPAPKRGQDGRPRTIALVGPTGVGKTTTIAKLAAAYKLRQGCSVGLVTIDTYRIAAVDQLRTYADIIGIPVRVAMTPDDIPEACEAFSGMDVVLIDTAGRSQHDAERIGEMGEALSRAMPHETHLVLSSASDERVLLRAVERFASLRPNRLIMTKLDEAVNYGVLLNVAQRAKLAISYVTNGQEVPDHIEPSRPERLAAMVVEGRA